jgi:hypothetical protein
VSPGEVVTGAVALAAEGVLHSERQAYARAQARWGDLDARKLAFLTVYEVSGNVKHAARLAGIDRGTHYNWLKKDAAYGAAFLVAEEEASDTIRAEIWRRATHGVTKPMVSAGEIVCYVQEYSDTLLLALAASRMPAEFSRTRIEHSGRIDGGAAGGASMIEQAEALAKLPQSDRDTLRAIMVKAGLA